MRADVVVHGDKLNVALKRFRRVSEEVRRDMKGRYYHIKPSEKRRLAVKKGREKWAKKRAAIERRIKRGD